MNTDNSHPAFQYDIILERRGGRVSDSRLRRMLSILRGRAALVLGSQGVDDYYALVEFEDGSHFPVPLLGPVQRRLIRRLRTLGTRGRDWAFRCPVCGAESFYSPRAQGFCEHCSAVFTEANGLQEWRVGLVEFFQNNVLEELRQVTQDRR